MSDQAHLERMAGHASRVGSLETYRARADGNADLFEGVNMTPASGARPEIYRGLGNTPDLRDRLAAPGNTTAHCTDCHKARRHGLLRSPQGSRVQPFDRPKNRRLAGPSQSGTLLAHARQNH
ncbi:hypothetical protein [Marichromatium gracile]|nr:hypothetical protein [Marichromatium gracile]